MTPPDTATEASADQAIARRSVSNGPFYGWLHVASNQGWLLTPHLATIK